MRFDRSLNELTTVDDLTEEIWPHCQSSTACSPPCTPLFFGVKMVALAAPLSRQRAHEPTAVKASRCARPAFTGLAFVAPVLHTLVQTGSCPTVPDNALSLP